MAAFPGVTQLPLHHLTIRVPWHDNEWKGTICNKPCNNTSCLVLPRVSESRDDENEERLAGQSIELLDISQHPPCVAEHATFMAAFDVPSVKNHPYQSSNSASHGHFAPTPFSYNAYSAAAVPFRWMLRQQVEGAPRYGVTSKAEKLHLDWDARREPEMSFDTAWVQEGTNQQIMLETFFSAVRREESLVFFYAKKTPLSENGRRVIVGAGRVKSVGKITEYQYNREMSEVDLRGFLWERNIGHSIRSEFADGFLFPYQELLELADQDTSIDIESHVAFAPNDFFEEYSYGSELLPHDGAIASLLECERAIQSLKKTMDGPWGSILTWINKELNRLWEIRGSFPGLGSALKAFGVQHGTLLAWHIYGELEGEKALLSINPWDRFGELLAKNDSLPTYLRNELGPTLASKWLALDQPRRALLDLLSRCSISEDQATRYYQLTEKQKAGIEVTDEQLLANPYLLFEYDQTQLDAIQFGAVDRGVFPEESVRNAFPLPAPSHVTEDIDPRRVRALCTLTLIEAAEQGHTLLPNTWLVERIRDMPLKPACLLDQDVLNLLDDQLSPVLVKAEVADGAGAMQLAGFAVTRSLITSTVNKRIKGKQNTGTHDWNLLVAQAVEQALPENAEERELEERARLEKASALEEIFSSRISVLVGSAGTGKSTLLKALCNIPGVLDDGLLLLAPTGKARVRLEQATGMAKQGQTIAQFLLKYGRYSGTTGRYIVDRNAARCTNRKTVIIDECSMLTEEQLASLLSGLSGVERLVLVGDPQQLPPIGAGRPFVDIVNLLRPEAYESMFPQVSSGYAGLTVPRRQIASGDEEREDLLLADYFSGRPLEVGADEIWSRIAANELDRLRLVTWTTPDELDGKLTELLVDELNLEDDDDEAGFGASIGGTIWEKDQHVYFSNRYKDRPGAAESVENWQILSPLRGTQPGVEAINRLLQGKFRKRALSMATQEWPKIPRPMGPQGIMWGDKVINIRNSGRRKVWPEIENPYVANGDIGVVVGQYIKGKGYPKFLEVEMAAQTGPMFPSGSPRYKYFKGEFSGDEANPPLELAYALTVHKTQGSEFGITFLVLPSPCRLLSREMLYTALTRHKDKVIIFYQGDFRDIQRYSSADYSEIARRLTNLFRNPRPVSSEIQNQHVFMDEYLIHRSQRGHLVRSKSELIIADKLNAAGLEYEYEAQVMLNGRERYPDFVITDDDSGDTYYWEHLGMMSDLKYRKRWEKKLSEYRTEGILPLEEGGGENGILITTEEYQGEGFDSQKIDELVQVILG